MSKRERYLLAVIILGLGAIGGYSLYTRTIAGIGPPQQVSETPNIQSNDRLIVVDSQRLFEAQMQKMLGMTAPGQAAEAGDRFAKRLQEVLDVYTGNGYVILPKEAVIAFPPRLDVTDTVSQALGLGILPDRGQAMQEGEQ